MGETIIVTGGCGYIGSQVVLDLKEAGFKPVVVDSFVNCSTEIAEALGVDIRRGDLIDTAFLIKTFKELRPVAVMHFAAFAYVGESVTDPLKYYKNNVAGSISLLQAMQATGVNNIIFSSTCATYGIPASMPITEETPQSPINPYGHSKLMMERIIKDCAHAFGLNSIMFRYFNAAGAHSSGIIGEAHFPESHIIPLAIYAAMGGKPFTVFGNDYDTPDGTCIRDYIHIADISLAHILGLKKLLSSKYNQVFNIGNGQGYSVMEVLKCVEKVSGKKVPFSYVERRPGDPPRLVAAANKLIKELSWKPIYPELTPIVESAWKWHTGKGFNLAKRCMS